MPRNGNHLSFADTLDTETPTPLRTPHDDTRPPLIWDWDIEHEDRKRERKADSDATLRGATPFEVDRRVLKDVVREKIGVEVGRISFLSAGMSWPSKYDPGSQYLILLLFGIQGRSTRLAFYY